MRLMRWAVQLAYGMGLEWFEGEQKKWSGRGCVCRARAVTRLGHRAWPYCI